MYSYIPNYFFLLLLHLHFTFLALCFQYSGKILIFLLEKILLTNKETNANASPREKAFNSLQPQGLILITVYTLVGIAMLAV